MKLESDKRIVCDGSCSECVRCLRLYLCDAEDWRGIIACFITFYVRRALQQKQQCIIYCMSCRSVLSENSGQILIRDSNTECMQIEFKFEFWNQSSKIWTSFNISSSECLTFIQLPTIALALLHLHANKVPTRIVITRSKLRDRDWSNARHVMCKIDNVVQFLECSVMFPGNMASRNPWCKRCATMHLHQFVAFISWYNKTNIEF